MVKCTKQQYERWNGKLSNGFRFDLRHFLMWGDKTARMLIDFTDGRKLEAKLEYHEERKQNGFGGTGRQIPCLHMSIWNPSKTGGMMYSTGLGKSLEMGEIQPKKNYDYLCKLSKTLDAKSVIELAKQYINELQNDDLTMAMG